MPSDEVRVTPAVYRSHRGNREELPKPGETMNQSKNARALMLACASLTAAPALAGSFEFGGIEADYKLTFTYAVGIRTEKQSQALINGPIDPFQREVLPDPAGGRLVGFTHTGQPVTQNFDDGDRNFKQWSLINNRLTSNGEISFKYNNYGAIFSGSAFYDDVYARGHNDNDSPATVNTYRENGQFPSANRTNTNKFTSDTRRFDGRRIRLLEAYGYGDFDLGPVPLNVRVGQQVATYGESLFFSGVASTQGPFDATKAFVAGAEIKDIILPVPQIAIQAGLTQDLTFLGEYQFDYAPTDVFPQGDYFSPADVVGPGATFAYGSANPLVGDCNGLLNFSNGVSLDNLCRLLTPLVGNSQPGDLVYAAPSIIAVRDRDIRPSRWGQYGLGLRYALTPATTIGAYRIRYHDHNPAVQLNVGYGFIGTVAGVPVTTQIINQPVPVSYNVRYFDGIDMSALSFSTTLGVVNVAGEFSYRQHAPVPVQAVISGVVSPVYSRGNISMAQISAIYTTNPQLYFDDLVIVNEVGAVHVNSVNAVPDSPGIDTQGNGDKLFYSRTSWAAQSLAFTTKRNILTGWDLQIPVSLGFIASGNPSLAGAFGALYGEGDLRVGVGAKMTYLQNLEFGINYNMFFGDPNKTIRGTTLKANPYSDRDYATISIKYNL